MMQSDIIDARWVAFQDNPLPGIHTDALASSLSPLAITNEKTVRMAMSGPRAGAKLCELLQNRYLLTPLSAVKPLSEQDAFMAAMSVQEWQAMRLACGTFFWSGMLAREIHASALRLLDEQLGQDWWMWVEQGLKEAGKHASPTEPGAGLVPPQDWSLRIHHSGSALLHAWRKTLDPQLAGWVKLKDGDDDVHHDSLELTDQAATAGATDVVARVCAVLMERVKQVL